MNMKLFSHLIWIHLALVFFSSTSGAKSADFRLSFKVKNTLAAQPKYLRFLRYQELMSLPKKKQLQYITGLQRIFSDLAQKYPEFSMNSVTPNENVFSGMMMEVLQQHPQFISLMSDFFVEANAQTPTVAEIPIATPEEIGGNPALFNSNFHYNAYVNVMSATRLECAGARVGTGSQRRIVPGRVLELRFRNTSRYICALTSIAENERCPAGYRDIAGEDGRKGCARLTTGSQILAAMQPQDENPDSPSPRPGSSTLPAAVARPSSNSTPRPLPSVATAQEPPAATAFDDQAEFAAPARRTAVSPLPQNCSEEIYSCESGDEARETNRAAFEQGLSARGNQCINGANISRYNTTTKTCARVANKTYGDKSFTCSGNQTLCNPLIFGVQSDGQSGICVRLRINVTLACSAASAAAGRGTSAENVLKLLRENPSMANAWNEWAQSLEGLCQPRPDGNPSHRFHCTECTIIFTHLQKLNALTGAANECGNLLTSLGEGDPMIVNRSIDRSLPAVLQKNPQTPAVTPSATGVTSGTN
jgi:hypothetical protein